MNLIRGEVGGLNLKKIVRSFGRTWPVAALVVVAGCAGIQRDFSGDDGMHLPDTMGQYGSLLDTEEFGKAPKALPASAFGAGFTPIAITLDNLPSIAMQGTNQHLGSPGSCEAQSFGYGLGTYTAARGAGFDASKPVNQASAAYLYKWAHHVEKKTCPSGSGALIYLETLIAGGAPTAQSVPYKANCVYLDAIRIPTPSDSKFELGSYATINIAGNPDAAVERIKEYVANGQAVAFSGLVLEGYGSGPTLQDGVIYSTTTIPNSGHGQLIVGYDDTMGDPANPGAFLVQNSFGTGWPKVTSPAPKGMVWWSYGTFKQTQKLAAIAYPRNPGVPAGASLEASQAGLPKAVISEAFQYAFDGSSPANLVLMHWFQEPVELISVTITEPGGSVSATQNYQHNIANGYTYFSRSDGQSFREGYYGVTLNIRTMDGVTGSYSGTVLVGAAVPGYGPATMHGVFITGTTGAAAIVN